MSRLSMEDFLQQLRTLRKMGPVADTLKKLPEPLAGMAGEVDEKELDAAEAILSAMTPEERRDSDLLVDESRRRKVAERSGRTLQEVNSLIAQFYAARRFESGDDAAP